MVRFSYSLIENILSDCDFNKELVFELVSRGFRERVELYVLGEDIFDCLEGSLDSVVRFSGGEWGLGLCSFGREKFVPYSVVCGFAILSGEFEGHKDISVYAH